MQLLIKIQKQNTMSANMARKRKKKQKYFKKANPNAIHLNNFSTTVTIGSVSQTTSLFTITLPNNVTKELIGI